MSCMVAMLQGGSPQREIFPIETGSMDDIKSIGLREMQLMLGVSLLSELPQNAVQYVGAALRPDGSPFYLSTIASGFANLANPLGDWRGAFFAPFGIGDIIGTVEGCLQQPGSLPTSITVKARLLVDNGGLPAFVENRDRANPRVSVDWVISGNQATRPNKSSLIHSVTIHQPGPHDPADIRRCIALHAPQRCFGEPRAIVAMQCGVAAAGLLEAIC